MCARSDDYGLYDTWMVCLSGCEFDKLNMTCCTHGAC